MSTSSPQSILVVEDEQSIASFVSLYLKNAGYSVRAVGTGSGALNAVAGVLQVERDERRDRGLILDHKHGLGL